MPPSQPRPPAPAPFDRVGRASPARVAGVYLVFGLLWIWLSDSVLFWAGAPGDLGFWASAAKGSAFVMLSAALVYGAARREVRAAARTAGLLRAVAEGTTDAVFVKDADGRYLFVNEAGARLVGRPAADVLGKDDTHVFGADDARKLIDRDRRVMAGDRAETTEEVLTAAGVTRTYLSTKAPYRDDTGRVVGVIGIGRDISDRKAAEVALRESEAQARRGEALLSAVMDALPVSMVIADPAGRIVRMNPASGRIWGPAPMSDRVEQYGQYVGYWPDTGRRIEPHEWPMARAVLGGETTAGVRVVIERFGDGGRRHLELSAAPVVGDGGARLGGVVACQDVTERVEAESALRESEWRFRNVFENAATGIGVADAAGRILRCNPAYCAIVGRTEDEMLAADVAGLIHPEDRAENMDLFRRLAAGEIPGYEVENRLVHKSGAPVWVHKVVSALRDGSGATTHMMALVTDVTERRRAERALRESEERYRRLVDVLPAPVFVHDGERVTFCNEAFVRLMGAGSPDELVGMSPYRVNHPDDHPAVRARLAGMASTGRPGPGLEVQVVRLDGRPVPVYSVATPGVNGVRREYIVALSDLSERERATELLRSVMRSVGDAILTIDDRGLIESANPATERLFGHTSAELIGRNVNVLMPEPHRGRHDGYIADYLRTGVARIIGHGREVECLRKDGSTFSAELTVTEFRLEGARRFTGVVRDLTARKRLEEQFLQAQKMEAIGKLAGGVAHDFNNLLTVINGYTDLVLVELPAGHPHRPLIAAVREAGERAAALTSQLLAFSRKSIVAPKVFDLKEVVAQSERLLRRLIGEDVVLSVVSHRSACWVHADPNQAEQVIMNLAVNARDAMPTGGRLTLETRLVSVLADAASDAGPRPGRYVELAVSDTGVGMTDEVKARIFEPFFTTKEAGKGTGLGLATVFGIVQQAGGQVSVESEVGRGATFRVLFPEAPAPTPAAGAGPSQPVRGGTETVLLVEDEDRVRELCRVALEAQGYTVITAAGGREAIESLARRSGPVHLLVTDVVMPEMSGSALAKAVRAAVPGVRVLYVSGYTDDAVVRHGVREDQVEFLQKPFTPLGLARKVRDVLDKNG